MIPRRVVLAAAATLPAGMVHGQPNASPFVGDWNGQVEGIGAARLIITAVRGDGLVEGRMEFELNRYVSTFGEVYDTTRNVNRGVVSAGTLTIEAALGGIYALTLDGNRLSGSYSRGTTFRGTASFSKS
jgi:hypothetical protein